MALSAEQKALLSGSTGAVCAVVLSHRRCVRVTADKTSGGKATPISKICGFSSISPGEVVDGLELAISSWHAPKRHKAGALTD